MSSLQGRVALVTGSSRGIGAAIATLFAREGAKVVVHGRDAPAMSAVTAGIQQAGGCAMQVTGDVTRLADLEAMRDMWSEHFPPLTSFADFAFCFRKDTDQSLPYAANH